MDKGETIMLQQIKTPKKRLSVEGHCVHSNDYSRDDLIPDLYHLRWNIKSSFKNKQDAWFAANTLHLCMVKQETVNLAVLDRQRVLITGLVKNQLCWIDAVTGTIYDTYGKCLSSDNISLVLSTLRQDEITAQSILMLMREPEFDIRELTAETKGEE